MAEEFDLEKARSILANKIVVRVGGEPFQYTIDYDSWLNLGALQKMTSNALDEIARLQNRNRELEAIVPIFNKLSKMLPIIETIFKHIQKSDDYVKGIEKIDVLESKLTACKEALAKERFWKVWREDPHGLATLGDVTGISAIAKWQIESEYIEIFGAD
jgi:hypothetical protein